MMKRLYPLVCAWALLLPVQASFSFTWLPQALEVDAVAIDTTEGALLPEVVDSLRKSMSMLADRQGVADSVDISVMNLSPYTSISQYTKGYVPGVFTQDPSGEPGSLKSMIWRGLSATVFSNKDMQGVQPTIFVNGIPLAKESNFAFSIQRYNFNKIGPETDLFTRLDLNTIRSIEVINDPAQLAQLGPLAANGAIWIVTHGGRSGSRQLTVNTYYGFQQKPSITPINAEYENLFRQPFYAQYGDLDDRIKYPGYLSDSTNMNYYGASDWSDLYYKNSALYAIDLSLSGGSERANFSFYGGHKNNEGVADDTRLKTYNAMFSVNMAPFEWFTVSSFINANRSERKRNRNLRDQFAETSYLPDLSTPLAPNKAVYAYYLDQHTESLDDNVTNNIHGYLNFKFKIVRGLSFDSKLSIDYTEGIRDVFWPSTLMEGSNFVSNYFGYTQRLIFSNALKYSRPVNQRDVLHFQLGSEYVMDLYRFNYARAYDGPNDFVKINVVSGNAGKSEYLEPQGGLMLYRWNNKDQFRMQSFYGSARYSVGNVLEAQLLARFDGTSTAQPNHRWFFSPAAHVMYNVKNHLLADTGPLTTLKLKLGAARLARPITTGRYAVGPQYSTNMGWATELGMVSYNGFAGISRPYNNGWVGYDMQWPYSDQVNFSVESSWWNHRLFANLSLYRREDKNQIINVPVPSEYGYNGQYKNGLSVRNSGVELVVGGQLFGATNAFQWNSSVNATTNKNTLTALPDGLDALIVENRMLKVGKPIDQFWVYENEGIFKDQAEIPTENGRRLAFEGVYLNAGDPRWKDNNTDFNIDDTDKVQKGRAMPKVFGAWNNQLSYKNFDLNFQLYFAVGHQLLNQRAATRYDFINNESNNTIHSVREIFHWQQDIDIDKYPVYNPWSSVVPYRAEQDLFLENASFVKLRSVTIGYDLAQLNGVKHAIGSIRRAYLYVSGNNLHTWTGFSGPDPELVEFNGYYTGYGMPMAPTYTLGIKLDI